MVSERQKTGTLSALVLGNPLMLILLTRSIVISIAILAALLIVAYFIAGSKSLRLRVWAFNLCAIASVSCHSELLFREFFSDKTITNLYELHGSYYFNKPFLDKEFRTEEYASVYKTNCQGYRIDEMTNAYDTIKMCDWLFIGDSFTQGAQVDYCDLYSTRLFRKFPNKVIVNAGMSGAGLYDELNYFRHKGKQLQPKVVFLQIGVFNDFFNIKEHHATYQDYLMEKSELYRYLAYNVFSTDSLPLGRWTEPFFPTHQDNKNYNILYKESSEIKDADISAFKSVLKIWKQEVESVGAELVLLLIPSKEQVSPDLLKDVLDRYAISPTELDLTAPNRLFAETASSIGVESYDLTHDFCQSEIFPFFAHDEHLNSKGHFIISEALGKFLQEYACDLKYASSSNSHDRYPTYNAEDSVLLYQGQVRNGHAISVWSMNSNDRKTIISSFNELVHPVFSLDRRYIAYTEGNQERSETDVILWDMVLNKTEKLNPKNTFAAIPMFNHKGTMLAFPIWANENNAVANIALYDMKLNRVEKIIPTNTESWRPIFSIDDKHVYFINKGDYFTIKRYDILTEEISDVLALPFDIWDITFSPSGNHMVFAGNKDGNWDLFYYSLTTKQVRQLTKTIGNEWDPSFGETDNDLWFAGTFGINDGVFYRRVNL